MGWIPFLILLITAASQKLSSGVYYFPNSVHTSVTFRCTTTDTPLLSLIPTTLNFNGSAPSFLFPRHLLKSKQVKHMLTWCWCAGCVLCHPAVVWVTSVCHHHHRLCTEVCLWGFPAGSVLVHGGSFLKSLTPCWGNTAPSQLLCWCSPTRMRFSGARQQFSIQ